MGEHLNNYVSYLTSVFDFVRGDRAKLYQTLECEIIGYYDEDGDYQTYEITRTALPSGAVFQIESYYTNVGHHEFVGFFRFGSLLIRSYNEPQLVHPEQPSAMELLARLTDDPYYAAYSHY